MWIFSIFMLITGFLANVKCDIDMENYYKMPVLHREENFERCLGSNKNEFSAYCTVSTLVKPDNSNAIWNQIFEFTAKKKIHFAHDVLFSGQCLSDCQKRLSGLTETELEDLYVEEFPNTKKFTYDITAYKNGTLYRKMYDKTFNQCQNLWLRENWNLSGYSTILWCTTNQEHYEEDYLHTAFLLVTFMIMGIVVAGTGLDIWQNNENSLIYYKVDRRDLTKKQQYLLCFSVVRNWYKLTAPPKTQLGRDLRYMSAIRYLNTLLIVCGHLWMSYSFTPMINPEYLEVSRYDPFNIVKIFCNCGTTIIQTFFLTSGFLLYVSFKEVLKEGEFNLKYFGTATVLRYIRLTPVYAYILLYYATYLVQAGSGPHWKFWAETELSYCRRNWWQNLLYINNYVNANQPCMNITWYLGADTHLFLVSLFLFMIMWKYPKYRVKVMVVALLTAFAIQFLVTHLYAFDPMFLMYPEDMRFVADNIKPDYYLDYVTSHTNAGNFFIGILGAMYFFHYKENKIDWSKNKSFIVLWYSLPVIGFPALTSLGYMYFHYDFEVPAIHSSLWTIFVRHMWAILSIPLVVGFWSSFRSPIKNFFYWPVFTPLSRLTYCIYLCHLTIGRWIFGSEMQSYHLSNWFFLRQAVSLFVLSNFAALVLCLCIEFPLTSLSKVFLRRDRKRPLPKKDEYNNNASELTQL